MVCAHALLRKTKQAAVLGWNLIGNVNGFSIGNKWKPLCHCHNIFDEMSLVCLFECQEALLPGMDLLRPKRRDLVTNSDSVALDPWRAACSPWNPFVPAPGWGKCWPSRCFIKAPRQSLTSVDIALAYGLSGRVPLCFSQQLERLMGDTNQGI